MFGRKKESGLAVNHYEGIPQFATDYPCKLELNEQMLTIKRLKPETTVTLERSRITSISAMEEENFMLQYHGHAISTSKAKGIKKYYLVIRYDQDKYLAFWGTAIEYGKFIKMQYGQIDVPSHISL